MANNCHKINNDDLDQPGFPTFVSKHDFQDENLILVYLSLFQACLIYDRVTCITYCESVLS